MIDYLKYYAGVVVLGLGYLGFALGGDWLFLGILTFPALALADAILPDDLSPRRMRNGMWANVPVWICSVGPVGLHLTFAWRISLGDLTGWQLLGGILSCGWLGTVPLVPAAHELYHMRNRFARTVGHYCHLCILIARATSGTWWDITSMWQRLLTEILRHAAHPCTASSPGHSAKAPPIC